MNKILTIYSVPVATYCAKLRITLRNKGLIWEELLPPGGYGSAEYKAIVPSGNLPALIDNGFMLADSEAIAEYLNEAYPDIAMLPDTVQLRAKAREKGRLHDTRLEPAVRAMYPQVAHDTRDVHAVQHGGSEISKHLQSLAVLLKNCPLDTSKLWLCDCGFAVTFTWIRRFEEALSLPVDWPETVTAYYERLQHFQPVRDELEHYKPAMDDYLKKAFP